MKPILTDDRCVVLQGDSLKLAEVLPENYVHAVVCDPPYELGFMNKGWDKNGIAFNPDVWRQLLRVLKPGGYLLAFGGTRTYHRMVCAIEDAGFEIKDSIHWTYATGFPKSMNIGKAIDDHLGADRPVVGDNPNHRPVSGVNYEGVYAGGNTGAAKITAPGSEEAARWAGWGTALKPGHEPIVVARKPFATTYAENILEHGVGGLNVDACRIGDEKHSYTPRLDANANMNDDNWHRIAGEMSAKVEVEGRWPANVVFSHDEACGSCETMPACSETCPVAELDRQSGKSKSRKGKPRGAAAGEGWGMTQTGAEYDDLGGASRFFFCAKPSSKERDYGLDHLRQTTAGEATDRKEDSAGLNSPRAGAGRKGGRRNFHPTVKPIGLLRWLCRLICPPGGTVLDPFAGSGSTGVACLQEGFNFIGVELGGENGEYLPIIEGRLRRALQESAK